MKGPCPEAFDRIRKHRLRRQRRGEKYAKWCLKRLCLPATVHIDYLEPASLYIKARKKFNRLRASNWASSRALQRQVCSPLVVSLGIRPSVLARRGELCDFGCLRSHYAGLRLLKSRNRLMSG